jgi:3-phenylpropionate/trans-cinnamate dioxygenase ferredoxin reductase component
VIEAVATIGAGQAAAVAARTLRRSGYDGRIHIIGDEAEQPYQRPPLSKEYLATGDDDGLFLLDEQWCAANNVRLHLGQPAMALRPSAGLIELADGSVVGADAVLLATGGRARKLPGADGDRVCYLRTLADCRRLRARLRPGSRLIVTGAGFIGGEVAATAHGLGVQVTVIEAFEAPLQPVLGRAMGEVCARIHREHGVDLRLGETVSEVSETAAGVVVRTGSGARIEGDTLVIGIGIEPNVELAERSGLAVSNGVLVDEYCRTDIQNVFAAGDVANHYHPVFRERMRVEHFDNASRQAAAAARNILGQKVAYDDPHWFWSDQYDVSLQYAGHASAWDEIVVRGSVEDLDFCAFYLRDGLVRAAFGVDRGADVMAAKELITGGVPLPGTLLADEDVDLAELADAREPA